MKHSQTGRRRGRPVSRLNEARRILARAAALRFPSHRKAL